MNNDKNIFQTRFERLYKNCKLFAIQLDGFSHTVFYKDCNGNKHIDYMSACAPEQYENEHLCSDGITRSWNTDKTKVLFLNFFNYHYQNNAKEYVFKDVKEW